MPGGDLERASAPYTDGFQCRKERIQSGPREEFGIYTDFGITGQKRNEQKYKTSHYLTRRSDG